MARVTFDGQARPVQNVGRRAADGTEGAYIGECGGIDATSLPLQTLLVTFSGRVNRRQLDWNDYLLGENQVLDEEIEVLK